MQFLASETFLGFLSILSFLTTSISSFQYTEEWLSWKEEYGKEYSSPAEELNRQSIFESNMRRIEKHNSGKDGKWYTMGMNEFGDLVSHVCKDVA